MDFPAATTIETNAFYQNGYVQNLEFPSVTTIASMAFRRAVNLTTLKVNKCTSIGDNAFMECKNAEGGTYFTDLWVESLDKSYIESNYQRIKIPSGVKCHCKNGQEYTIPNY